MPKKRHKSEEIVASVAHSVQFMLPSGRQACGMNAGISTAVHLSFQLLELADLLLGAAGARPATLSEGPAGWRSRNVPSLRNRRPQPAR